MVMKIVPFSDTHGYHSYVKLPMADMAIFAGDLCNRGTGQEALSFLQWYNSQPHKYKIFIAGNHDFVFENQVEFRNYVKEKFPDLIYLENESVVIEGIKIYGSPVTPNFHNWAFMPQRGGFEIKALWERIPADTDILVTHGPPRGYGDRTRHGDLAGCDDLLARILEVKPKYNIFGHIHEGVGIYTNPDTIFMNVSVLNERYIMTNDPVVFEYERNKKNKISFDFDDTLDTDCVQKIAKQFISEGCDVHIVTSRVKYGQHLDIDEVAADLGIPESNIHFTDGGWKHPTLHWLNVTVHYDNCQTEIQKIADHLKSCKGVYFDSQTKRFYEPHKI